MVPDVGAGPHRVDQVGARAQTPPAVIPPVRSLCFFIVLGCNIYLNYYKEACN